MSFKGRLGEAVLNRMAAISAVQAEMERAERPVLSAARAAAYSSLEDAPPETAYFDNRNRMFVATRA